MLVHHVELQAFTWNGSIFSRVWTLGCNMRCGYCFVPDVILSKNGMTSKEVYDKIRTNRVMDAVCVTGGEPTIWKDLPIFMKKLKLLGLKVMLETNGTNPDMIKKLITRRSVDFIRLDLKAPAEKYKEITGVEYPPEIDETIKLLNDWSGYWEITTVWHSGITKDDLRVMVKKITGKWVILPFVQGNLLDNKYNNEVPIDESFLSSLSGPKEIWVRTKEHERRLK